MESQQGQSVKMSEIAKGAGISRQALYLHFGSRTDLLVATVDYINEVKELDQLLKQFETARSGSDKLDICVTIFAQYIPEIYGVAKVLISTRDTDKAAATAWNDGCMNDFKYICFEIIKDLDTEGTLAKEWSTNTAGEMLFSILSVQNWEQLIVYSGWSKEEYIQNTTSLLRRTFIS